MKMRTAFVVLRIAVGLAIAAGGFLMFSRSPVHAEAVVITDPDDPKFDPKEFRFGNYLESLYKRGDEKPELLAALIKTFPPGTSKAFIEDIIINKNRGDRGTPTKEDISERLQGYSWETTWRPPSSKENPPPVQPKTILVIMQIGYDENGRSTYMRLAQTRLYGQKTRIDKAEEEPDSRHEPEMLKAMEAHENKVKAVRKKYLGSPDGYLDESNSNHGARP